MDTSLDEIDSPEYLARLLTKFDNGSKYIEQWNQLKRARYLCLACNPLIKMEWRKYRDAFSRLKRWDDFYKAYCLQVYSAELEFFSWHTEKEIHLYLVTQQELTSLRHQLNSIRSVSQWQ